MNTLFSGLMYASLAVFLLICLLGAAVIATGMKEAIRNRRLLIEAQRNHKRKDAARKLVRMEGRKR